MSNTDKVLGFDPVQKRAADMLISEHYLHTVIFYGSRSTHDHQSDSDIDILGFSSILDDDLFVEGKFESVFLDAWIYRDDHFREISASENIKYVGGLIYKDQFGWGKLFLKNINAYFRNDISKERANSCRIWVKSMWIRSQGIDINSMYRKALLKSKLLEMYCNSNGDIYLGHRKTLKNIERREKHIYDLFDRIYSKLDEFALEEIVHIISSEQGGGSAEEK